MQILHGQYQDPVSMNQLLWLERSVTGVQTLPDISRASIMIAPFAISEKTQMPKAPVDTPSKSRPTLQANLRYLHVCCSFAQGIMWQRWCGSIPPSSPQSNRALAQQPGLRRPCEKIKADGGRWSLHNWLPHHLVSQFPPDSLNSKNSAKLGHG